MGEKEWYFFSLRDRKYPTGVRTNRATNTGYWKTTGKDKEIFNTITSELVGMKKTLVFYRGRAPRGEKTNWFLHEYRIHSKSSYRTSKQDEWAVCRVFQKSAGVKKYPSSHSRAVHPYNTSDIPPQMMMQPTDTFHFLLGRNYMNGAELQAELTKAFRGGGPAGTINHVPTAQSESHHITSYPAAAGCFTISGLNLNLGGATSAQPVFRPPAQPPTVMHHHQDLNSSMLNGCAIAAVPAGYVADMNNNAYASNNRFMGMDHCADLDNYWAPY